LLLQCIMARPLRLHVPGVTYHVMSRGNDKQVIFRDEVDYSRYVELLQRALQRFNVRCHAYCALGNHVHLVLTPGEIPLSRMMQQLNSTYCQWFNRRHKRVGHVLQGRYKAVLVDSDGAALRVIRYVTRNPVKDGLVEFAGEWKWSSGPATLGLVPVPDFLDLSPIWRAFQSNAGLPGYDRIEKFLAAQGDDELNAALFIGSPGFGARLEPLLKEARDVRDFVFDQKYANRPPLMQVLTEPQRARYREHAAFDAFERYAYTLREIAEVFRRAPATIWVWIQKVRTQATPALQFRLNELLV
jgi:putative transposase